MPPAPVAVDPVQVPAAGPTSDGPNALHRGRLSWTGAGVLFLPCGETQELAVFDEAGVATGLTRESGDQYVEVDGARLTEGEGANTLLLRGLRFSRPAEVGDGCARDLSKLLVQASGQEPFWSVDLRKDRLSWVVPGAEPVWLSTAAGSPSGTWLASTDGHSLTLRISGTPCRDASVGAWHGLTVAVVHNGASYSGCGVRGWAE